MMNYINGKYVFKTFLNNETDHNHSTNTNSQLKQQSERVTFLFKHVQSVLTSTLY